MCPGILNTPGAFSKSLKHIHAQSTLSQTLPLKLVIENYPESLSKLASINYIGHYPTGGSFKQLEHYR